MSVCVDMGMDLENKLRRKSDGYLRNIEENKLRSIEIENKLRSIKRSEYEIDKILRTLKEKSVMRINMEKIFGNIKGCTIKREDALSIINQLFMNMNQREVKRIIHDLFTKAFPEYEIEKTYNYDYQKEMMAELEHQKIIQMMKEARDNSLEKYHDLEKSALEKNFLSKNEMEI